jgi:hypothetical protein
MNKYTKVFGELSKNERAKKIIEKMLQDHFELVEGLLEKTMVDRKLRRIFDWLLKVGKLYHIDECGILYIHGGVPFCEANAGLYGRLDDLEAGTKRLLSSERVESQEIEDLELKLNKFLEVRETDTDSSFSILDKGQGEINQYLRKMGIMGLVYAHAIKDSVQVVARRVFGIDLGMASSNFGSYFTVGPQGIKSFIELKEGEFAERAILTGQELQDLMFGEVDLLIESLKNYFVQNFVT